MEIRSHWRSEHATLWLSEEAAEYVCTYDSSDPPDKALANTLEPSYMEEILAFFEQAANIGDRP